MKKFIYSLMCILLLCSTACRKYVEVPPENLTLLRTTAQFLQLLNSATMFDPSYYMPLFSADDVGSVQLTWQNPLAVTLANAYSWNDRIYGAVDEDADWSKFYQQIYNCNVVISQVMKSEEGSEEDKLKAKSYALVHRAYAYFTLVNMYAKQYNPATANTDPGVPMVLEPKFTTSLERVSVEKVYNQIKEDLNEALPNLSDAPDFINFPSKLAAYGMLARTYLNTRDFKAAELNSDNALRIKSSLLDLRLYVGSTSLPNRLTNPEEFFLKRVSIYPTALPVSATMLAKYDLNDLRYSVLTRDGKDAGSQFTDTRSYFKNRLTTDGAYVGPNVPEMMLIKAECEARAGNPGAAVDILNKLRKTRFQDSKYIAFTAATADQALKLTIDERQREFAGRGLRWFDQRRLALDPGLVTTVTRVFKGVTYTIEPGSNRYTYAIADKYIQLNPEITQNPR